MQIFHINHILTEEFSSDRSSNESTTWNNDFNIKCNRNAKGKKREGRLLTTIYLKVSEVRKKSPILTFQHRRKEVKYWSETMPANDNDKNLRYNSMKLLWRITQKISISWNKIFPII
jgi:hypothetical protein